MKKLMASIILISLLAFLPVAHATYVKYIGRVDVKNYSCQHTPESSFIDFICVAKIDTQPNVIASMNSTVYGWCYVPDYLSSGWLSAVSKGRYFNHYIKGRFDCR